MIKTIIIIANSVGYRPLRSGTNELKLTTCPYKAARGAFVAGTATHTKSLYEWIFRPGEARCTPTASHKKTEISQKTPSQI